MRAIIVILTVVNKKISENKIDENTNFFVLLKGDCCWKIYFPIKKLFNIVIGNVFNEETSQQNNTNLFLHNQYSQMIQPF